MTKIANVEINGLLALAPMAGVSDVAFRQVCRECGAALTVTEMVSAKALVYEDKKTRSLLLRGQGESPLAAQIFGSEPDFMAKGARIALEISGADIIDINMGCPVGKIAGHGEGSALMKTPALAYDIISAVCESVSVPVTVKFRKGWDNGNVNAVEFACMAQSAGAAAVTIHGRTRAQMYSGVVDWDIIRDVKRAVSIPVIANGDIFEPEGAEHILRYTGADMAMIGRGSFGNPWIFSRGNAAIEHRDIPPLPPLKDRVDLAVVQFELAVSAKGEHVACLEARRHFAWYLKAVAHSGYFKQQIVQIETLNDIYRIANGIKRELR